MVESTPTPKISQELFYPKQAQIIRITAIDLVLSGNMIDPATVKTSKVSFLYFEDSKMSLKDADKAFE